MLLAAGSNVCLGRRGLKSVHSTTENLRLSWEGPDGPNSPNSSVSFSGFLVLRGEDLPQVIALI